MTIFCTLSHWKISGWAQLTKAEQHNGRSISTPAREEGRPMPIELLEGQGDFVERTKALLGRKGVPTKIRKNGVLGFEDVYGASPEYWDRKYPQGWRNVAPELLAKDPVIVAAMDRAKARHGENLVSVRLHLDEKSPHVHTIAIPLVTREHKQRGRKRKDGVVPPPMLKTTLYASHPQARGGSARRLEEEHDQWAAACAHIKVDGIGLERGKRGSDLTEEERRDRKMRDGKGSRQGEERARLLAETRRQEEAARHQNELAHKNAARAERRKKAATRLARWIVKKANDETSELRATTLAMAESTKMHHAAAFLQQSDASDDRKIAASEREAAQGVIIKAERAAQGMQNEASLEKERVLKEARKSAAAERAAAKIELQKASALKKGIEAWVSGDIKGFVKKGDIKSISYRDADAKLRLHTTISSVSEVWEFIHRMTDAIGQKTEALLTAAQKDREEAHAVRREAVEKRLLAQKTESEARSFAEGIDAWADGYIVRGGMHRVTGKRTIRFAQDLPKDLRNRLNPAWDRISKWVEKMTLSISRKVERDVGSEVDLRLKVARDRVTQVEIELAALRLVEPNHIEKVLANEVSIRQLAEETYARNLDRYQFERLQDQSR